MFKSVLRRLKRNNDYKILVIFHEDQTISVFSQPGLKSEIASEILNEAAALVLVEAEKPHLKVIKK
jgi:hypothetical protein